MQQRWLVKHPEVEEAIDLAFYRPLGYGLSRLLQPTAVSPDQVTIASAVIGVLGGHLLLHGQPLLDALGAFAIVFSALLDSVDGQLARLRGTSSRTGRMHDGMSDSLVFISVYLHLAGRLVLQGASPLLLPFALALVANQFLANALADLYRHAYLRFALLDAGSEDDFSDDLRRERQRAGRDREPWLTRMLLWFYVRVAVQQEQLNPRLTALRRTLIAAGEAGAAAAPRYRQLLRPLVPQLAWLGTNVRVLLLLLVLPFDAIGVFFWANLTLMNLALVLCIRAHERRAGVLLGEIAGAAAGGAGEARP
jgi:hypothetical protein